MFTELGRIIEQYKSTVESNSVERAAPYTGTEDVPEISIPMVSEALVHQFLNRLERQIRLTECQIFEALGHKIR